MLPLPRGKFANGICFKQVEGLFADCEGSCTLVAGSMLLSGFKRMNDKSTCIWRGGSIYGLRFCLLFLSLSSPGRDGFTFWGTARVGSFPPKEYRASAKYTRPVQIKQ